VLFFSEYLLFAIVSLKEIRQEMEGGEVSTEDIENFTSILEQNCSGGYFAVKVRKNGI